MLSWFRTDLLLAALVLGLASAWAAISYREVQLLNVPVESALSRIPKGPFTFVLAARGACFARFDGRLEQRKGDFGLTGTGTSKIRLGDRELTSTIEWEFAFNSLGQLGGGVLRVRMGQEGIVIGATNVSPITVQIRSFDATSFPPLQFSVPGPVLLQSNGDETFRVIHEGGQSLGALSGPLASQPVVDQMRFRAEFRSGNDAAGCTTESLTPLDITELSQVFGSFSSRFSLPSLMGGAP